MTKTPSKKFQKNEVTKSKEGAANVVWTSHEEKWRPQFTVPRTKTQKVNLQANAITYDIETVLYVTLKLGLVWCKQQLVG